jgi:hypothetical protein
VASRAGTSAGTCTITTCDRDDAAYGCASGDRAIRLIVLSPHAKVAYTNSVHYTHSSTPRTVEELLGVSPLLNDAANAADLSDLFATFP